MITVESAITLFHVYDVPTSVRFYRDVLGFEVVATSPPFTDAQDDFGWCQLRLGGADLMLNNMYENNVRPESPVAVRRAAHGDTTIYLWCRDVDGVAALLRGKGVDVGEPQDTYYGMRQVYLKDPDGYGICFQWVVE